MARDDSETQTPTSEPAAKVTGQPIRSDEIPLLSSIGSGLLAQQPAPTTEAHVTVAKVCPQCDTEYETGDRFCPKDGAPLKPKGGADPLIGRVIADRYLILAKIGEGGMGRVYAAEHVKMNRQCAIKVMNPALMHDAESTKRFAREASNAARILHPNVAAVFDYGEADKVVYLVMEYIDGESLSTVLGREGTLDPRRAIDIARQVADGLTAAHELGIIHRDLKPDNVIIARKRDGRETAKVVDFGIAKAVSDSPQDALTRSGLVIGTPEYMSPEQLLGDPVNARTDIYALGCILYQMLTGVQPFASETREQMIRRRLNDPPPHVRDALGDLPRRLDTLIAHMLARSPGDRLATAAAVSSELDPALALSGWVGASAAPMGPVKMPRGSPTVMHSATDQPTIPIKLATTNPAKIAVGALIGLAIALSGLMVWSRITNSELPTPPATQLTTTVQPPAFPPPTIIPGRIPALSGSTARHDSASASSAPKQTVVGPIAPPAQKPMSHADSIAASAAASEPSAPNDESAIKETLNHFALAMTGGEVAILREFPKTPQTTLDALKGVVTQGENIKAVAVPGTINVRGDHAEVRLTVRLNYQMRDSKAQMVLPFLYHATLTKEGDKWEIATLSTPNE